MGKLEGKVAIVTGATSGMGQAIAELFAREGAAVVVGGRDRTRGEEVVDAIGEAGGTARLVLGDVAHSETSRSLVEEAVGAFGGVDILVPNAGTLGLGRLTDLDIETWKRTLDVNLTSVFYLLRRGIPKLAERGGGTVVVNGSIAAFKAFPGHPAYCASKGALLSLVRQVALDYGPAVRINIICPGPVDTPLLHDSAVSFPEPEKALAEAAEKTVLGRLGTPADVASVALFLASDDSGFMTGSAVTVDGGVLTN